MAGLSSAYHIPKKKFQTVVIEQAHAVGGTARSVLVDGFTFDFTGHLLHLHFPYTRKLIQKLLKDNVFTCVRKAAIFSKGVTTPYPFQVNTYGLPKRVVEECVRGFMEAVNKYSDPKLRSTSLPFAVWSERTFGKGIHKHFMKSYNEKLWQTSLQEMTAEWCGMFVPQPKIEDVIAGSKGQAEKDFGYNATFLYPKKGGIQVLPEAMAKGLNVRLNTSVESVFWKEKRLLLSNGECQNYDYLVSSIPLVELIKKMKELPAELARLIPKMRWTSVICLNLGVNRPKISDKSWIYFPEKKFVFYRVGFPMNFTPHAVPKGCSSMYVEVSFPHDKKVNWEDPRLLKRVQKDLVRAGILRPTDKIVTRNIIPIRYAYVIYTKDRKQITDKIFSFLRKNNIFSVGRYGEWKYSFMEEAILDGKKAADKIAGKVE